MDANGNIMPRCIACGYRWIGANAERCTECGAIKPPIRPDDPERLRMFFLKWSAIAAAPSMAMLLLASTGRLIVLAPLMAVYALAVILMGLLVFGVLPWAVFVAANCLPKVLETWWLWRDGSIGPWSGTTARIAVLALLLVVQIIIGIAAYALAIYVVFPPWPAGWP